jgi:hypothetical protein
VNYVNPVFFCDCQACLYFLFYFFRIPRVLEIGYISLTISIKAFGSSGSDGKSKRKYWNQKAQRHIFQVLEDAY